MFSASLNTNHFLSLSSKTKLNSFNKPHKQVSHYKRTPIKVVNHTTPFELVSHGIVYVSIFYCTMNWNYYRNIRIKAEKKNSLKDKRLNKK